MVYIGGFCVGVFGVGCVRGEAVKNAGFLRFLLDGSRLTIIKPLQVVVKMIDSSYAGW